MLAVNDLLDLFSVYSAFNAACPHQIPFDGSGHGILNMKDFLIGYDVLRDYLFNFLNGRLVVDYNKLVSLN